MSEQTIKTTQNAYVPTDADFRLKDNAGEITIDTNFAAQSFWKDVTLRFFRKTSAWIGLFLIIIITFCFINLIFIKKVCCYHTHY